MIWKSLDTKCRLIETLLVQLRVAGILVKNFVQWKGHQSDERRPTDARAGGLPSKDFSLLRSYTWPGDFVYSGFLSGKKATRKASVHLSFSLLE